MKALQPKFLLDRPNQEDYTYIMCCLNYKNVRMKVATGDYILPGHWDKETQRPTTERRIVRNFTPIQNKEMRMITHHLDDLEFFVKDQLVDMRAERNVDLHVLKDRILEFLGRKKEVHKITKLSEYIEGIIQRAKNGDILNSKQQVYGKSSIANFMSIAASLRDYESVTGTIYFESVNSDFLPSLIKYYHSISAKHNTISLYIAIIKNIFTIAKKEGYTFDEKAMSAPTPKPIDVDTISLTKEELATLYNMELTKTLSKVRDLFLIGCYTLMRFSDYSTICPENIRTTGKGIRVIDNINQKTKKRVVIPFLFPELDAILAKYDYTAPKMSAVYFGAKIKEIARMAGIDSLVTYTETFGGSTKTISNPKYSLITTHTARRTGATILYLSGYPISRIKTLLGHSTEEMTIKYLKVSLDENAELMMELPFS